jgi:site-specific recombinase XerD
MLEKIYHYKSVIQELRCGVLDKYIDYFAAYYYELGYARKCLAHRFAVIRSLSQWLTKRSLRLADLDEEQLVQFAKFRKKQTTRFLRRGDRTILSLLINYLRREKAIPLSHPVKPENKSIENITQAYAQHLDEDKGLCASTIKRNKGVVHEFLTRQFGKERVIFSKITQNKILTYLSSNKKYQNPKGIQINASCLRSFLRYSVMIGKIRAELANCIPSMPGWRAAHLPVFLVKSEIKQLLKACDRRTHTGCRNYAILLLLVRLGLRASEVINLSLDDINWELGELTICGKGRKYRVLPLPDDVGEAMVTYLRCARPKSTDRQVFVRSKAPYKGLGSSSDITSIVCRALKAAGLHPRHMGAHLLRYTAAAETLNKGGTLFEIGQLLGHSSVDTTALYVKLDINNLRELAQPWLMQQKEGIK